MALNRKDVKLPEKFPKVMLQICPREIVTTHKYFT